MFDRDMAWFWVSMAFIVGLIISIIVVDTNRQNKFKRECKAKGGEYYRGHKSDPICLKTGVLIPMGGE